MQQNITCLPTGDGQGRYEYSSEHNMLPHSGAHSFKAIYGNPPKTCLWGSFSKAIYVRKGLQPNCCMGELPFRQTVVLLQGHETKLSCYCFVSSNRLDSYVCTMNTRWWSLRGRDSCLFSTSIQSQATSITDLELTILESKEKIQIMLRNIKQTQKKHCSFVIWCITL